MADRANDARPVRLAGVEKRFGNRRVLAGLDLTVDAGEIVALLGANGTGKSTMLGLIMGFDAPSAGTAATFGVDPRRHGETVRTRIGYVPDAVALYDELSGVENIAFLIRIATGQRLPAATIRDALATAGLPEEAHDRRTGTYSKGMRQKVALALAFCKQARLLILDEPTTGLDLPAALELNRLIEQAARGGAAVLMATHDLLRARQVATRLIVLEHGRIALDAPPSALPLERIEDRLSHTRPIDRR